MRGVLKVVASAAVAAAAIVGIPNLVVCAGSAPSIKTCATASQEAAATGAQYDCVLVLGAAVRPDGTPSPILQDRLDTAAQAYAAGLAPKVIVSGDNESDSSYNEVKVMKAYLVAAGVPSEDVFCDHAGLNTYDSMYRARNVFGVNSMVVVTQTYHLYRALFDARCLGMQAVGVSSDLRSYSDQGYYDVREVGARVSDSWKALTKQRSRFLSEPVSLSQSGDVTDW